MKQTIKDIIMPIETAGLTFKNPFIVASGPASKEISQLIRTGKMEAGTVIMYDMAGRRQRVPGYRLAEQGQ